MSVIHSMINTLYYAPLIGPPLNWKELLNFLKHRLISEIEQIEDDIYYRAVRFGDDFGVISVSNNAELACLSIHIPPKLIKHISLIINNVRNLFDLDATLKQLKIS